MRPILIFAIIICTIEITEGYNSNNDDFRLMISSIFMGIFINPIINNILELYEKNKKDKKTKNW